LIPQWQLVRLCSMGIFIAVPEPTSLDSSYNAANLPAYLEALEASGAVPVVIDLHQNQSYVARLLEGVQGVLFPGSRFDIDPQRYGALRTPECSESDPGRAAVDELIFQDAFSMYKPILAICHGMQALNVWRNGTLIQDLKTSVNHRPGRGVAEAHPVSVVAGSRFDASYSDDFGDEFYVNSSHHQAVDSLGDNLKSSVFSGSDGVIEAVELDSSDHYVLGVQWHPERTFHSSALSRQIFRDFVEQAGNWTPRRITESV